MSEALAKAFEAFTSDGGGRGPAWVVPARRAAFGRFAEAGFPTARDEEWRFTPITPIASTAWRPAGASPVPDEAKDLDLSPFEFGHPDWATLVFVNGRYASALSRRGRVPAGVVIEPLAAALEREPDLARRALERQPTPGQTSFAALNAAFAADGAVIRVPAGVDLGDPVHVLHVSTGEAQGALVSPRILLVVERGARAQLVESYAGVSDVASLTNAVTNVEVEAGGWVEHTRIQRESTAAYHLGFTRVDQERDSHYRSFTLAIGGAIARHDLHARLGAENVETLLYGLYLGDGTQLVDNHTVIFHDEPHCRSWEVYKGILDGRSRAVFNGKVLVRAEAQKTDAKQTNRNLLLSDGAKVDTKPQLEIFADDVKCTHGATVGRLDEGARFYLRSRGIPADAAQRLLTYAFAAEVVAEVASAPVREALDGLVRARLGN
ncbi:MAG: Fe-S cluster assembly protein SufD [Gemmatimonadales bacterium]